ncbi:MAG: flagellar biosynthesis protein FlhF [Lachnospiraceae bacterium]|nr:flagellar biosynthesis protein FlhF [Lachnospiraceae bacterium]
MIIKKYQGKTEQEAFNAAKKELGEGVVLMNVRNVKSKGLFAFLKSPVVEVTVALEEETEKPSYSKPETPKNTIDVSVAQNFTEAIAEVRKVEENARINEGNNEKQAIEKQLDNIKKLIEETIQKPEVKDGDETGDVAEEAETESVAFMKLLYNTMIENEVSETYANKLLDEMETINKPNVPIDHMLENIYQKMILKFGSPEPIAESEKKPKVVFFIGPTGVGKTTTIAKIASKFIVESKKRVTLLTADTYRIAAAEQLRTYANILDVPFRVIFSAEEMECAVRDFRESDYILVDTTGHSWNNVAQKEAMMALISAVEGQCEMEVYLVVSATTKYKDLIKITDAYKEVEGYRLIFTKLDETSSYGNLLNLHLHTGASMSYVTDGQNVPDDIAVFNPQNTVKLLLGGKQ